MRMVLGMGQRRSSCRAISQVGLGLSGVSTNLKRPLGVGLDLLDLYIYSKPRVRIAFPEFGFGSGLSLPGSDSDRFRRARFGFGSVSPGQVRIRIGFCTTKPGSVRFWNWSICILAAIITSGGNASIITKLNAGCNYQPFYDAMPG